MAEVDRLRQQFQDLLFQQAIGNDVQTAAQRFLMTELRDASLSQVQEFESLVQDAFSAELGASTEFGLNRSGRLQEARGPRSQAERRSGVSAQEQASRAPASVGRGDVERLEKEFSLAVNRFKTSQGFNFGAATTTTPLQEIQAQRRSGTLTGRLGA